MGIRIKRARQHRGMNKNQLARALGTSWQHMDNWERGRVEPTLQSIRKLAEVLEVSADFLLGLPDSPRRLVQSSLDQFLETLAPTDLSPQEADWLRGARVDHANLQPSDYAKLLSDLRQLDPSKKGQAKSGPRPKIDRGAIARNLKKAK